MEGVVESADFHFDHSKLHLSGRFFGRKNGVPYTPDDPKFQRFLFTAGNVYERSCTV